MQGNENRVLGVNIGFAAIPRHRPGVAIEREQNPCQGYFWMRQTSETLGKSNVEGFQGANDQPVVAIEIDPVFPCCRTGLPSQSGDSLNAYLTVLGAEPSGVPAR